MTVSKVKVISSSEYARRRDEIFFRITKRQLSELYGEYEADEYESIAETAGGAYGSPKIMTYDRDEDKSSYAKPYLILDIRDKADYDRGHLLQARNFPYTLLRRDMIPPELYSFRNKPGMLILVYCNDEKDSREAAKTFVDRGTENIYLLSGGMLEFASEFPFYIEGEVPPTPCATKSRLPTRTSLGRIPESKAIEYGSPDRRKGAMSEMGSPSPMTARSARSSSGTSTLKSFRRPGGAGFLSARSVKDDRSESGMSTSSNISVAESIISRASSRKGRF